MDLRAVFLSGFEGSVYLNSFRGVFKLHELSVPLNQPNKVPVLLYSLRFGLGLLLCYLLHSVTLCSFPPLSLLCGREARVGHY